MILKIQMMESGFFLLKGVNLWYTLIRGVMMKYISIICGKITSFLCGLIGRGSSFPGNVSLMIDRNILRKFKLPKIVILVTGSSGKGSTTKIIANTFQRLGYSTCYNKEGGNQTTGLLTTLIKNSTLTGRIKTDVIVLETDERYMKFVGNILKPTDVIITNITRDQPPRQKHIQFIKDEIEKGLFCDAHLYLNANDPFMQTFNVKNKITYFSIDKLKTSYKKNIFGSLNCPRCPKCNASLEYDYYHIEDIGAYRCTKCSFEMPCSDYTITGFNNNTITINGNEKIIIENDMLYNLYNTLAAYSLLRNYINDKDLASVMSNINKENKVYNMYKFNDRSVYVLNNKCENASTYNQSILYTLKNKNEKTIIIGWEEISRRYLWDELSWLYDIEFELFNKQKIDKIIVAGPQKCDIAVRLKYAGIDEKKIVMRDNLYFAKNDIKKSKGDIYAILNFDYLNDFNKVMEELK